MSDYQFWDELGKIFNAVVAYQEKAVEFNKRFINPWIPLGNVFDRQERNNESIRAFHKAIELDPANAQNWYELANIHFRMKNHADAVEAYRKVIEMSPDHGAAYSNLALALVAQGRLAEAIPLYQRSLELLSDDKEKAVAWNRLGNVHRKLNEYTLAVQAFQKADELDAENAGFRDDLDEQPSAGESARPDGSLDFEGAAAVESLDPLQLIVAKGRADEFAEVAAEDAVKETAEVAELEQGDEVAASPLESVVAELAGEAPVTAQVESLLETPIEAAAIVAEGLPEAAASDAAEPMHPDFAEVESTLSEQPIAEIFEPEAAAEVTAPDDTAVEDSLAAATDVPVVVESLPLEAVVEASLELVQTTQEERTADADSGMPHAADAFPGHVAYEEYLKDNDQALNIMINEAGEQIVPEEQPAQQAPAAKIDESGELQIEMDAKNAHVWNELGNIYFNNGEFDDAVIAYSKSIELDRWFAWPYSNLALTYVQKNRFAEAILLYQRSIELFKDEKDQAITWNRLGNVYRRLNDYDNAIAAYQHADDLDPDNATLSLQSRFSLLGSYALEPKPALV